MLGFCKGRGVYAHVRLPHGYLYRRVGSVWRNGSRWPIGLQPRLGAGCRRIGHAACTVESIRSRQGP